MSNYSDLLNIDEIGEKKNYFESNRGNVSFFCKDCEEIVETKRENPSGYIFICNKCNGKNIAIGTNEGLKANYRIK